MENISERNHVHLVLHRGEHIREKSDRALTSIAENIAERSNSMKKWPRAASEAASMGRLTVVTRSVSEPTDSSGSNHQVFWRR